MNKPSKEVVRRFIAVNQKLGRLYEEIDELKKTPGNEEKIKAKEKLYAYVLDEAIAIGNEYEAIDVFCVDRLL